MYVDFLFLDFIRFICNFIVINIIEKYFLVRFIVVDVDNYGKLQVYNNLGWYFVCDINFDDVDVRVACKILGYKDGRVQFGLVLGIFILKIIFSIGIIDVDCIGNEVMFRYC